MRDVRRFVMNEHIIYKYKILECKYMGDDVYALDLPIGSKLLSVAEQHDEIVLYALVMPELPVRPVNILVLGTGQPITVNTSEYEFLGTVKLREGKFMFHIFYKRQS